MDYDYRKYNHRSKSLKSANNYLSRFYENLDLDYDDEVVYDSTVKNLMGIKQLCDSISKRIDTIVSRNSKELNEIKYTYLSIVNSLSTFKYLNYQSVSETSKHIDSLVNNLIANGLFSYDVAEQLPVLIVKLIFIQSIQSVDYEYVRYLHSLNVAEVDINRMISRIDLGTTAMYALVLYDMLWENKLKPMGKYHNRYYLTPDSMYEFVSNLGISGELLNYYTDHKNSNSLIEQVGIK